MMMMKMLTITTVTVMTILLQLQLTHATRVSSPYPGKDSQQQHGQQQEEEQQQVQNQQLEPFEWKGYAVDCPGCEAFSCPALPARRWCRRAVPDDCGCCSVCAAGRGERCYPAVVGLNWLKCAKGLRCRPAGEDEFGDTYGLCEDCPAGTYGLGCSGVCNCLSGRCEPESGKCHRLPFVQNAARPPPKKRLAASHTSYRWHRTG
ncbi:endothelial cell-specific molecule 1 [Petromyzon marinus]|uniref:Endothelial cell-specific molecule 1 n=1 Tax=Petromyzon marinus TaxID=7757 RepID=A0AAJ7T278_PETMA|nr:endothelial cell-specific molecule 1 [Petromyzon marinus]XP_032809799.1 endothelial cell-specific molecule 1 [Petromyzon marinus]